MPMFETIRRGLEKIPVSNDNNGREIVKIQQSEKSFLFDFQPSENVFFGRQRELQIIQNIYEECISKKSLRYAVITGLGGIGKTQIAKYFAKRSKEKIECLNCIWINGSTTDSVILSFTKLASQLEIPLEEFPGEQKLLSHLIIELYKSVFNEKCILIFDNLNSYEEPILQILTSISSKQHPKKLRPFVIITSRNRSVKEYFGNKGEHIPLNVFPLDDALQLVKSSLNIPEDDTRNLLLAKRLCERLSCFPFALQQALSYMAIHFEDKKLENKFQNLLSVLDEDVQKVLEFQPAIPSEYSFHSTWLSTFKTIETTSIIGNLAIDIMKVIAFLNPENIPMSLIQKILPGLPDSQADGDALFHTAYIFLWHYSMCEINKHLRSISINPLLQEVVRLHLAEENAIVNTLDAILHLVKNNKLHDYFSTSEIFHFRSLIVYAARYQDIVVVHGDVISMF